MPRHARERGQTIILVAIGLISLLAMAALAIDVVTLYAARSETQRAADATALAAAKAIADSGFTTLSPNDPNIVNGKAQALAQSMATAAINAMLTAPSPINQVAGMQPGLVGTPILFFPSTAVPPNSNPHITVTLQVTTLPTFFARIWGNRTATVTASATAEAYNPANVQSFTPIAPKGVKPWLVANLDPNQPPAPPGTPFINITTGVIEPNVIGESLNLHADCKAGAGCTLLNTGNPPGFGPQNNQVSYPQVDYVPAKVTPNSNDVCPLPASCTEDPLYPDYQYSIQCHDVNPYPCGGSVNNTTWDNTVNPRGIAGPSALGAECLIRAANSGTGQGQDLLLPNPVTWPAAPFQFSAQSGPQNGNAVTTSSSIVTIPIIDQTHFQTDAPLGVTVVGFMQAFIDQVQPGPLPGSDPGDIQVTVLNIAGCSATPNGAPPVVGSGTSPVPVRLITPP
ncbi:MAG TPA: pilus assembly protein TadG-related protein [Terriglobales bacterium]|nr:pilus assembly protein TadG-related protein [Terriglobales bacterium]